MISGATTATRLAHSSREPRVFPLPPLERPRTPARRGRVAQRAAQRLDVWKCYEELRIALNDMYRGRADVGTRRPDRRAALTLEMVPTWQRSAVNSTLRAAQRLSRARRGNCPTGAAALREASRREASESYVQQRAENPYVPLVAGMVAAPSDPTKFVDMMQCLP